MSAQKKNTKKTNKAKTKSAPKTAPKVESPVKCCDCQCGCNSHHNSGVYVLIASLVAVLIVLVMACAVNVGVNSSTSKYAVYKGKFLSESTGETKDESNITILSAGAVIDMIMANKTGFLIIGQENCLGCDAFARRVGNAVESTDNIYRYNLKLEADKDDKRAINLLGLGDDTPDFLYISEGEVYDRIDDVKSVDDLNTFLTKYGITLKTTE